MLIWKYNFFKILIRYIINFSYLDLICGIYVIIDNWIGVFRW